MCCVHNSENVRRLWLHHFLFVNTMCICLCFECGKQTHHVAYSWSVSVTVSSSRISCLGEGLLSHELKIVALIGQFQIGEIGRHLSKTGSLVLEYFCPFINEQSGALVNSHANYLNQAHYTYVGYTQTRSFPTRKNTKINKATCTKLNKMSTCLW